MLQVALDLTELDRALQIGREAIGGGVDWLEAGTPLVKSEGMAAVRALHEAFPAHTVVADLKIVDTGALEVEMAAKAGASVVCVLAVADDAVIAEAVRAADLYGVRLMADLISVPDPVARARELEAMGVHIVNAHVGIDQQMRGESPLGVLSAIRDAVGIPLAAAGGLNAQ
ncbi:MAG: orotidine 5'-phosphate decarboxylase / HUMPS family protein, partial [Methanolinea sp.]